MGFLGLSCRTSSRIIKDDIYFCNKLDEKAESILKNGGKVFLLAAGNVENGKDVVQYLKPVFWNTSWFKMRPPHTTGILCNPNHPAFADFPTEFHSNLQWWGILDRQQVMNLELFPPEFQTAYTADRYMVFKSPLSCII